MNEYKVFISKEKNQGAIAQLVTNFNIKIGSISSDPEALRAAGVLEGGGLVAVFERQNPLTEEQKRSLEGAGVMFFPAELEPA